MSDEYGWDPGAQTYMQPDNNEAGNAGQPVQPDYNEYENAGQPWQQQGYGQPYNSPPVKQKKDGIGFGIASMVLGILSVLLFMTCVNYLMAILAIIFAILQLCTRKRKGMAITGIITSVLAILMSSLLWIGVFVFIQDGGADSIYNDLYNDYYYYDMDDYSTWYYDEL